MGDWRGCIGGGGDKQPDVERHQGGTSLHVHLMRCALQQQAETAAAVRQVEKLTLEAEHSADPPLPARSQGSRAKAAWKPNPVAMWLPAATSPTKARPQVLRIGLVQQQHERCLTCPGARRSC